jgi:hypothetical protein
MLVPAALVVAVVVNECLGDGIVVFPGRRRVSLIQQYPTY